MGKRDDGQGVSPNEGVGRAMWWGRGRRGGWLLAARIGRCGRLWAGIGPAFSLVSVVGKPHSRALLNRASGEWVTVSEYRKSNRTGSDLNLTPFCQKQHVSARRPLATARLSPDRNQRSRGVQGPSRHHAAARTRYTLARLIPNRLPISAGCTPSARSFRAASACRWAVGTRP